jgi:putative acetyltransferase
MRTDPARRGQGIASMLLDYLIRDAQNRGIKRISLETGSMPFFAPARALYARAGFDPCPPFGNYADDANSAFLTRSI